MRLTYLTILFAVLAAAFLPGAAHAQDYEYCGDYVCESYAVYDPTTGEINGYARTVDYGEYGETGLRADATLSDPNGNTVAYATDSAYGEADAYVWWAVGSFYGDYGLQGAHWYYIEDDYMEGGDWLQYTNWSAWAEPQPVIFSCGGPWYPGYNSVNVSGSGFTGQSAWITGSFVDSSSLSVMSDSSAQGWVQVDTGITSPTYASVYVGSAACTVVMEPDPTPNITNVTPSPWQAGSGYTFTVSGTGFGTSANVIITGPDSTQYYNGSCSNGLTPGSQPCGDTSFTDWVTVPWSAPTGNATVTMTSNGYNGLGFLGSQQLDAGSYPVQVAAGQQTSFTNPAGEVSSFVDWQWNYTPTGQAGLYDGGRFSMTLLGHGPNGAMAPGEGYAGIGVFENLSGFRDGCFQDLPGSAFPEVKHSDGLGSTWWVQTVWQGGNPFYVYGYDFIGMPAGWVGYYLGFILQMSGENGGSCSSSVLQQMKVVLSLSGPYASGYSGLTVSATGEYGAYRGASYPPN